MSSQLARSRLAPSGTEPTWPTLAAAADPAADMAALLPAELAARREWLRQRRWQKSGRNPWLWLIVLAIALVHLVWWVALHEASRPRPLIDAPPAAVQVRLIELAPPPQVPAAPKELEPLVVTAPQAGTAANSPAPPRPAMPARPVAPAAAQAGTQEAVVATPSVRLYNPDGSLRLPSAAPQASRDPMAPGFAAAAELRDRGHNVVRCRSTRFAGAWKPDESVGDEVARKYLGFIGLYNPHSAAKTAERAADARSACDGDGF